MRWPTRPTGRMPNSGWRGSPILCWWDPRAEWRRCGPDAWIRQAGTRCLHILAEDKRRLLRPEVRLVPAQPDAGLSCPMRPPKAVTKHISQGKGDEEMLK